MRISRKNVLVGRAAPLFAALAIIAGPACGEAVAEATSSYENSSERPLLPLNQLPVSPFATTDRFGGRSSWTASLAWSRVKVLGKTADAALRMDGFFHVVTKGGIGMYGELPLSYLNVDTDSDSDSATAAGNFEVGATFPLKIGRFPIIARGGLLLASAGSDVDEYLTNIMTGTSRMTDFAQSIPKTTWIRLSGSPLLAQGIALLRGDFGIDLPIQSDVDADPLVRANLAAGARLGSVWLAGELCNLMHLGSDRSEQFLHTFAFTLRGAGELMPYTSIVVPLDEAVRETNKWSLVVGLSGEIH